MKNTLSLLALLSVLVRLGNCQQQFVEIYTAEECEGASITYTTGGFDVLPGDVTYNSFRSVGL